MAAPLRKEHLVLLKKITGPAALADQLQELKQYRIQSPAILKAYHDILLFYTAFPPNKEILLLATEELKRVTDAVKRINAGKNTANQNSLSGSGIAGSDLLCSYSFSLAKWLVNTFPGAVSSGGSDADPAEVAAVIQLLLPAIEFERSSQRELSLAARIKAVSGIREPAEQLKWLIRVLDEHNGKEEIKELLFQQLKVFIQWDLDDPAWSRTFLKIPVKRIYYHTPLQKKINSYALLRQPVIPRVLTGTESKAITDTVKASLAFYYRETDPFTYALANETVLLEMGRGLQIALIGMQHEKRLSLESYIGYMAFRNGVPVAYGGGWIWGKRCRIGVNIYPPFRKGESAWLFCQVMRAYYQYYGVRHFIVRPYQFGKSNPEGIRSGAFWFYYKLGFRPSGATLKEMAEQEWKKIIADRQYRTKQSVLKQFTGSNLEWLIDKDAFPSFGADELSAAISKQVNKQFACSRKNALNAVLHVLAEHFSPAMIKSVHSFSQPVKENFLLLCGFIPGLHQWRDAEKKSLVRLWELKSAGRELQFISRLQQHKRLWSALENALAKN